MDVLKINDDVDDDDDFHLWKFSDDLWWLMKSDGLFCSNIRKI